MRNFTNRFTCLGMLLLAGTGITQAQVSFTNSNNLLHSETGVLGSNANIFSGNAMALIDVNNDGLDDIVKLDNNRYVRIEYQQLGGTFTHQYIGDVGSLGPWGMSMADVDHNGYKDILINGGSQAYLFKLNATGTGFIGGAIALPNGDIFCQNGNFMDVNNDGWEDIFMCNDVNESRIWVNNGSGSFPAESGNTVINFDVTAGSAAPNDESGNYSSVWTDFDNDGDVDFYVAHCRQGQPPGDIRRTDRLFVNNGSGTYTENGAAYNLASNDQDWTASFGDIDNDGDFDVFLTKHDQASRYYVNNGSGNMTIAPTAINFGSMPMQAQFEDFDNDGFVDLIITGDNDHRLYKNTGTGTFTDITPAEWNSPGSNILSFVSGDLNHDGKIDIYTSYGSTYNNPSGSRVDVYWKNTTDNNNHFLTLDLRGTASTDGALGARAYIYGAWGVQTREVRASESYGTVNSYQLHFGLGAATSVDSVVINWPATGSPNTVIVDPAVDQFLTITEGNCTSPENVISYAGGSPVICPPGSLTLNASTGSGYSYLWSTGATTSSISVSTPGEYSVRIIQAGNACVSNSATVMVEVNPDQTPAITASGDLMFCPGGSVTLTSSEASGNTWSNAQTSQSINVTTAGSYYVTYAGACQNWNSDTLTVTLYSAPAPTTTDDVIPAPGTGTVTATGSNIKWYDAPTAGTLLYTGPSYTTPVISVNTTYYAEDTYSYGAGTANVGSTNIAGSGYSGNTINGYLEFDVTSNCTLVSVQVEANAAGLRIIELRNSSGTVLQSYNATIPVGTSTVTLNFPLTPGTGYQLGTNTAQNNTLFGSNSPRLVRDNTAPAFPYTHPGYVSITTGNNGSGAVNAYYYFYDWVLDIPANIVCASERTPATVFITAGLDPGASEFLTVYPNPATDFVNVEFTTAEEGEAMLSVFDILGKKVYDLNMGTISGKITRNISTVGMAKGAYIIKLNVNGKEYHTQFIVK